MMRAFVLIVLMTALALPAGAAAETLYVRARPSIPLASAPGAEAVVLRRLVPGEAVNVLGREGGFVNVETGAGEQGWLSEADLTAVLPPAARAGELETELAAVRRDLAAAQNSLRSTQAELRQAQQAAATARNAGQGQLASLESEAAGLRETLASRDAAIAELRQRIAELEMAQEAARLLAASRPAAGTAATATYTPSELAGAGVAGLLVIGLGAWFGAAASRRRLRRRYHGLEL